MKKLLFAVFMVVLALVPGIGIYLLLDTIPTEIENAQGEILQPDAGRSTLAVRCQFFESLLDGSDCAWLHPTNQGTSPTALPLVILRAWPLRRSRTATIYLSGGPGGASYLNEDAMFYWRSWIKRLGLDHDLVLYDQRGSGDARPGLACRSADVENLKQTATGASVEESWVRFAEQMETCAVEVPLPDRHGGLYATATAAQDLRELVRALRNDFGYVEVHLYGASYGSRLAQVALSEPLPGVSRVVLDGFYPAGIDLNMRFADDFAQILDAMDRDCAQRSDCAPAPDGLRELLNEAMQQLGEVGTLITLSEPLELDEFRRSGKQLRAMRLTAASVLFVLENELTVGKSYEDVRVMLEEALDGRIDGAWPELLRDWLWLLVDPDFNSLAYALIECRDNPPTRPDQMAATLARHPQWRGALDPPEAAYKFCDQLGVRPEPLSASVIKQPVLLIAAAFDPRTPTAAALEAAKTFPQLSSLVLQSSGHVMTDLNDCAAQHAGRFLNKGNVPLAGACQ